MDGRWGAWHALAVAVPVLLQPRGGLGLGLSPSAKSIARRAKASATRAAGPKQAGWFGEFDQMESTYDPDYWPAHPDLNRAPLVEYGKDPARGDWPSVFSGKKAPWQIQPAARWVESASGGPADAWQTFFPSPPGGLGSADERNNAWRNTPEGWLQDYKNSDLTSGNGRPSPKQAQWFDSSVRQYDAYGRRSMPNPGTPRMFLAGDGWVERAVNTTIACATPGCNASAVLQAFDATTEEAGNCRLNIVVHPTDFDDDYSMEQFEYWKVNGKVVNARCDPRAKGCNDTAAAPLYPCLTQFDVMHLIDPTVGTLDIEGKLSPMVDECPYQNNLLDGVVVVSCMVRVPPPTVIPPGYTYYTLTPPPGGYIFNKTAVVKTLFNASAAGSISGLLNGLLNGGLSGGSGNGTFGGTNGSGGGFGFNFGPGTGFGPGSGPNGTYGVGGTWVNGVWMPAPNSVTSSGEGKMNVSALFWPTGPLNPASFTGPAVGGPTFGPGSCAVPCPVAGPGAGAFPGTLAASGAAVAAGTGNVPLQCDGLSCVAEAILTLDTNISLVAQMGGQCYLSVAINQTDFDMNLNSDEQILFVNVESTTMAQNIMPGQNPCQAAYAGTPLPPGGAFSVIVPDFDVTQLAAVLASLRVTAQISTMVDECGSNGFLFDGLARVDCIVPSR